MSKVWFITGASKGLGLNLIKKLIAQGYRVAATSRDKKAYKKLIDADAETFLPLTMNLTDNADVKRAIDETVVHFGTIDVVVNNAGYGLMGAIEEVQPDEVLKNFDVNVYGTLNVIRNVLPVMRKNRSGHIMNISSIGGFVAGFPGFGIYCATKFAVQGLTEALQVEVKPLGINATCVSPGYFRTGFLSSESLNTSKNQIADYEGARESQRMHENEIHGNQAGNPEKAADVFIALAKMKNAPVHLFMGSDSYQYAEQKMTDLKIMMNDHKDLATSTDYAE